MLTEAQLKAKRDEKLKPALEQNAPVYMISESINLEAPSILFNVLFRHNLYFWVNRRYRYDGFNDVMYYMGQHTVTEAEAVAVQENAEPYLSGMTANVPNTYGG